VLERVWWLETRAFARKKLFEKDECEVSARPDLSECNRQHPPPQRVSSCACHARFPRSPRWRRRCHRLHTARPSSYRLVIKALIRWYRSYGLFQSIARESCPHTPSELSLTSTVPDRSSWLIILISRAWEDRRPHTHQVQNGVRSRDEAKLNESSGLSACI
jgi:hypothetical protein